MKNLIILLISIIFLGCRTTYVYNIDDGPGSYNSYHNTTYNVYYWNGSPYYGFWDGYYYYYGYPHVHPWNYYYSYQPPCWYRPHLHVHHSAVYVVPVNGWKYNNKKGGSYNVPEKYQSNRANEPRPHQHDRIEKNPNQREDYVKPRNEERKPPMIKENRPTQTTPRQPIKEPRKQPNTAPKRNSNPSKR
jgi:hypothetical protein